MNEHLAWKATVVKEEITEKNVEEKKNVQFKMLR